MLQNPENDRWQHGSYIYNLFTIWTIYKLLVLLLLA